tara:strand:+ start:254 stop:2386 length:2133 start_codon:yes stop_codon:yes gene_type:complete
MKKYILIGVLIMNSCNRDIQQPVAMKKPYKMINHNDERSDDYYWMRLTDDQKVNNPHDDQAQSVIEYINMENFYTKKKLASTEDLQEELFDEIVNRIKKDDQTVPYFKNGYFYYTRYKKGKEYAIYCRKKNSLDSLEEIILDANVLSKRHEYFSIGGRVVSPNNEWLAYTVDTIGRTMYSLYFKNLKTKQTLNYSISNVESSVAWGNDNSTIYYTLQNNVTLNPEKVYRHILGSNIEKDKLVYHEKDGDYWSGVYRSKSGEYIIIYSEGHSSSDYQILRSDDIKGNFINFTKRKKNHKYSIAHSKDKFYVLTNLNAPNNRLMETSIGNTKNSNWKEVITHREEEQILEMEVFANHLVLNERVNGLSVLRIINESFTNDHYIDFNEETYSSWISRNREFNTNVLRYVYTSMIIPSSTFDYHMDKKQKILLKRQEVIGGYSDKDYKSERLYANSRDGKKIPISIVYKRSLRDNLTPQNLILYGYGAYGDTEDPYFSSTRLSMLDRGFIFAIANIRGSQIFGRQSYDDGKLLNKKNTFNDFIDAGKFLIDEKYTDKEHLFCYGGSAGGLLIGAVINMEPHMWKGAIASVPFVDVVTTGLDSSIPLTTYEWVEWGDPSKKEYYDYMLSYSPYDQVSKREYPNLLVTAGFYDASVQYWEPLKWVAKLRANWEGENELYLHMNMDAGHYGKSGRFRKYREYALEYAFLLSLTESKD